MDVFIVSAYEIIVGAKFLSIRRAAKPVEEAALAVEGEADHVFVSRRILIGHGLEGLLDRRAASRLGGRLGVLKTSERSCRSGFCCGVLAVELVRLVRPSRPSRSWGGFAAAATFSGRGSGVSGVSFWGRVRGGCDFSGRRFGYFGGFAWGRVRGGCDFLGARFGRRAFSSWGRVRGFFFFLALRKGRRNRLPGRGT